jgi:glycosyltransferase involved in cell wall biosynthesis
LFRKDALIELGSYNERLARNQDNDMNERLRAAGHRLYLTWRTNCMYRSRRGLRELARYGYNNGYWNFVTLRENPRAMRPRHFVPMVFVLGTAALFLLTAAISIKDNGPNRWLPLLAVSPIVLHLVVGFLASLPRLLRTGSPGALLMPVYVLAFHASYGVGMIAALLKRARAPVVSTTAGAAIRVVFLTHYFHPEVGASQTRILECARLLHERGYEVSVLTGFPNYPDGVIPKPYRRRLMQTEMVDGFRVLRSAVYPAPNRGFGRRIANHLSFAVSSVLTSWRAGRADVVVAETPPLFTAAAAVAVARLRHGRLVLNVADLWPESAVQLGALKNRFAIRGAEAIERFAYRHADLITVPTPGIRRTIENAGDFNGRVKLLPNAVDVDRFEPDSEAHPNRVIYCGTVGLAQGVRTLLEAARQLEEDDTPYEILIVGDGAERAELEATSAEWGLRSVKFTGRMRHEEVPEIIASAGVAVMLLRDVPLFEDALPTKLLEYMAAGRPVVAAAAGQVAELLGEVGAGIVCPPEDATAVAAAVRHLTADPARARRMGQQGRRYVEATLSRVSMVDALEAEIKGVLAAPRKRVAVQPARRAE